MPRLTICVTNCELRSRDDGNEYDDPEKALAIGVESGVAIISDEVRRGKRSAAVEVSVVGEDDRAILRAVVALSVSRLISQDSASQPPHPEPDFS